MLLPTANEPATGDEGVASPGPRSTAAIGVLVIDDQLAVREGVSRLISCSPFTLRAIGSAATAAQALALAERLRPDVAVLDVDLAGEDGLALIPRFPPGTKVLVLSCHGDPTTRARAHRLGARAFVEKHQPAAELLALIVEVASGLLPGDKAPSPLVSDSPPRPVASSAVQPDPGA